MGYVKERIGKLSTAALLSLMTILLIAAIVSGISVGTYHIEIGEVWNIFYHNTLKSVSFDYIILDDPNEWGRGTNYDIVWGTRAPRAFMACIIGMSLALAGVVMQATVQNPLADPYILGMSSGASLGATAAIAMGITGLFGASFGNYAIAVFAFLGSFICAMAVLLLSSAGGRTTSVKLVLSGTIIASLFGAVSNLIVVLYADKEEMQAITFWLLGSFGGADWDKILIPLVTFLVGLTYFITQIRNLNTMLMGDDVATTLGIDLSKKRRIYVLVTALLTATAVCFCGIIGFVGLMIPHIVRGITGNNHWKLIPISILLGATFMVVADILARKVIPGSELPIGIITAFCGAPVFAYIMIKKSYSFSN